MTIEAEGNEIVVDETAATDTGVETPPVDDAAEPEDDVIVTIGEAPAPEPEETDDVDVPKWVPELRKQNRALVRELKEKDRKLEALTKAPPAPVAPALGPKPTLRDDDVDFDEDKFEAKLLKWNEQKRKVDEEKAAEANAWKKKNDDFNEAAAKLKAPDFDDAKHAVIDAIDPVRQGILMKAAAQPHVVVLALGRQPEELKKLAAITDLVDFTVAVTKLEGQIKVSSRKPPPPERTPSSTGRTTVAGDKTLEALEREFEKTGDRSKINAYKRAQKEQHKGK